MGPAYRLHRSIEWERVRNQLRPGKGGLGTGGPAGRLNRTSMAGKKKSSKKGSNKTFASKRTMNPPQAGDSHPHGTETTGSFQQHDAQRRLGGFEGRGEHARTGNRGHQ